MKNNLILAVIAIFWAAIFAVVWISKARAGFLGLPFITIFLIGLAVWLTRKSLKSTKDNNKTENKQ